MDGLTVDSETVGVDTGIDGDNGKAVYTLDEIVTALQTGNGSEYSRRHDDKVVTYSIGTGQIGSNNSEYTYEMAGYVAMTKVMEETAREAYELWDELIAIDLVERKNDVKADMTFNYSSNSNGATYARTQYAWNGPDQALTITDSDIWLADNWRTHNEDSDLGFGGYGFTTYIHEIGHSLGLSHPGDYNGSARYRKDAGYSQDTRAHTVMSYFQADADGSGTDHTDGSRKYASTPLLHDIATVQAIYGADMTTRTGDNTYGFNAKVDRDVYDFTKNTKPIIAIWDADGEDTIDFSGFNAGQTLNLNDGEFSSTGKLTNNVAIAFGAKIENGVTGDGNDRLIGNEYANDLTGNGGDDTITGGKGNDTFFFAAGDGDDVITDFALGKDTLFFAPDLDVSSFSFGQTGGDLVIGYGEGDSVRLNGLKQGDITARDLGADVQPEPKPEPKPEPVVVEPKPEPEPEPVAEPVVVEDPPRPEPEPEPRPEPEPEPEPSSTEVSYAEARGSVTIDLDRGTATVAGVQNALPPSVADVEGSDFKDKIRGDSASNTLSGGKAKDQLWGKGGADTLNGDGGNDKLYGGGGNDMIVGGRGNDRLDGNAGADILVGGEGKDFVTYSASNASVAINLHNGTNEGGHANGDTLLGIESIVGSKYDDILVGDGANNTLNGSAGDDLLMGRSGRDRLVGGDGEDTFQFRRNDGNDTITDFAVGEDQILFINGDVSARDISFSETSKGLRIDYGKGAINLDGLSLGDLSTSDLLFT